MTELEWLSGGALVQMWDHIAHTTSERKVRLFGCAVFQFKANISTRMTTPEDDHYNIVNTAERYADGNITAAELRAVSDTILRDEEGFDPAIAFYLTQPEAILLRVTLRGCVRFGDGVMPALFHELFGNPFRPAAFHSEWQTDTVLAVARQMYESRDFSAMPILADALQDAGCENEDILNHCRGAGPHVRGCWVVDAILGKA